MSIEVFERTEKKYLLSEKDYKRLMNKIEDKIEKDKYYKSYISNIYYDTDNFDLIVNSIEKPIYKEKVRLRSYNTPTMNDTVFLEVKKKYKGVVSKRRVQIKLKEFYEYIDNGKFPKDVNKQIMREIDYCFKRYDLKPKMFLAYDRLSYYDKNDSNFRITFDTNIRSREFDLKIEDGSNGNKLFKDKFYLMELKAHEALPMWIVDILSSLKIYPISFSKYGKVYEGRKEINYV